LEPDVTSAADAAPSDPAVHVSNLSFGYDPDKLILDIPSLSIARRERVFVFGPSGSGKTTLLGLLAGVLRPGRGKLSVLGHDLGELSGFERDEFRALHIGYIFQMFNLIPYLSVLENIVLPCRLNTRRCARLGGQSVDEAGKEVARQLGIGSLLNQPVTDLSVGQQQRVAAARALLGHPELVIADEPTSALDSDLRQSFLELLFRSCEIAGATLIFVSHDRQLMPLFTSSLSQPEVNRISPAFGGKKERAVLQGAAREPTPPGPRKWV
jgi:putative ABC transport system ATP-binding protein